MTDSDEEAREGFPREGLDPCEATLESGDRRILEGSLGCDPDCAQEGARAGLGLRAGGLGRGESQPRGRGQRLRLW